MSCVILHMTTCGLLFAIFSQINHLNEMCLQDEEESSSKSDTTTSEQNAKSFQETNNENQPQSSNNKVWNKKSSWAARQVETSNNFATHSNFWHIFSNGLNLQIEHHLFPGLNHC